MKKLVIFWGLIGLSSFLVAQHAWDGTYQAWNSIRQENKIAYVNGVVAGSAWIAVTFVQEFPFLKKGEWFDQNIPFNVSTGYLVDLVDAVYRDSKNRDTPYIYILWKWRDWERTLGRL